MAKGNSISKKKRQGTEVLCDDMSFAASEAYKLLRTNLNFTLQGKEHCVIGITSSVRGEGKSTASVNLSYTFAQAGKSVLLIDADMRLPSIAKKLDIHGNPGLSNLITGIYLENASESRGFQKSKYFDNWHILPAGEIPPNPSELLGSEQMRIILEKLRSKYDVIIIDLPPVNIVSDALVISEMTDGMLVVVRHGYTNSHALDQCMYQIRNLNVKMLGFVMADVDVGKSSYKYYKHYGNYGYDSYSKESAKTSKRASGNG